MDKTLERFWNKVAIDAPGDCWEWLGSRDRDGYGVFWYGNRTTGAHRVAWEFASGQEIPDGLLVRHSCDNPSCCNPAHLELGTRADNMHDMAERGRSSAKLTEADVREIRGMDAAGELQRDIAEKFGISRPHVSNIATGRTWAWLGKDAMTVYYTSIIIRPGFGRPLFVSAASKSEAAVLFFGYAGANDHMYIYESRDRDAIAAALSFPGKVFARPAGGGRWAEVPEEWEEGA